MLTSAQLIAINDWLKYCRFQSDDTFRANMKRIDLPEEIKGAINHEQQRRIRELKNLEHAIDEELSSVGKGVKKVNATKKSNVKKQKEVEI